LHAQIASPDWSAIRDQFPVLSHRCYLNTGAVGPVSAEAAAASALYYQWCGEAGEPAADRWRPEVERCRIAVAELVNARPFEIGFVPNTSMALNCAALLFEGPGAVLTARGEHPSVVVPWHARGLRVDKAEPDRNGKFTPDCYERALRPDTQIIAISHVRYNDGQVNDLAAIGALARSRGLHLVVDAIHCAGMIPLDVGVGIDVLGFGGFKWLNAGHGSGAIFVRDGLIDRYGLPMAGRRSRATDALVEIDGLDALNQARAFELGSVAVGSVMALGASLQLLKRLGPDRIRERVRALTERFRNGLRAISLETATDELGAKLTPIVSVLVTDADRVAAQLADQNIIAAPRGGYLRISISWYNNDEDIDRCLNALASLAASYRPRCGRLASDEVLPRTDGQL